MTSEAINLKALLDQTSPEPSGGMTDEQLADIYLQQYAAKRAEVAPLDPALLFRFCCLGLAGVMTIAATFTAWLFRPVDALAQAEALRTMSASVASSQAQVAAVVESANPPEYKCSGFLTVCNFPDQHQAADAPVLVQQQPEPLPASLGHAIAVEPIANPLAVQTLQHWDAAGYDEAAVAQFIRNLYGEPMPGYPAADDLAIAYREVYLQ